eukprot:TRINITY_DN3327_c0_g1_i10.p2 TRINITY_DN3327_c0_g1~~TRINITY_DN3327_c0_g1_i10.p2  ORF type:complete len:418 (+),score=21.60 TRINITY_DN3327_c0_g1_i10:136-1389(+)
MSALSCDNSVSQPLITGQETKEKNIMQQQQQQDKFACQVAYKQLDQNSKVCFLAQGSKAKHKGELKLWIGVCLALTFMLTEATVGYFANSIAVMADAVHMFSDVSGYLFSILTMWIARQKSKHKYSFGYHRAEIFGALMSILILWLVTGILVYEACLRLINPPSYINGKLMSVISGIGVVFNLILIFVLNVDFDNWQDKSDVGQSDSFWDQHDHCHNVIKDIEHDIVPDKLDAHIHVDEHSGSSKFLQEFSEPDGQSPDHNNINVRAALIHVFGDLIQSIGVFIAGLLIFFFAESNKYWYTADPVCTFLFGVLVVISTLSVMQELVGVLMEAAPDDLDPVVQSILDINGVHTIHDVHMWSLSPGVTVFTAHVDIYEGYESCAVLRKLERVVNKMGIHHSTIQVCTFDKKFPKQEALV